MAENIQQNNQLRFITSLATTLRQISIYPAKHPVIANSIKSICASLVQAFGGKDALNLSISPDKRILIDGQDCGDKNPSLTKDVVFYFRRLEIEDLVFTLGIAEQEIFDFIHIILSDPVEIKKSGDINKLFSQKGISHISVKQFSYLKVEKGKEGLAVFGERLAADGFKAKVKDYCADKIKEPADIQAIEKEALDFIRSEFSANKKVSSQTKTLVKKFFMHCPDKQGALLRFKSGLLEYGLLAEEADNLVNKITGNLSGSRTFSEKKSSASKTEEHLVKENERLMAELEQLQAQVKEKDGRMAHMAMQNKKISGEKQRIDNIIHNMAEGMVVVDSEGKILLLNSAAESLLGITKQDIGKAIKDVIKDEHLLTVTKNMVVEKNDIIETDIEFLGSNESTKRVLRTSSAVVEDHNGNTLGMVTTLNDITRQKEVEKLKADFLANVSHELRTPLVAIEKSVSMILAKSTGEISSTQEQFLSIAERNLKRLTLLINDLLDLSKLEAARMELSRSPVFVNQVIAESCDTFASWAKTKSISFEKNVSDDLPLVNIDSNRVIQVLTNLINNAMKFTPDGGKISVCAVKKDQELEISVSDTGPGIDPVDLKKIFEKFFQTKEKSSADINGTGIGLALVREIVQLHGGRVWAESVKGVGSKFIFTLPVDVVRN